MEQETTQDRPEVMKALTEERLGQLRAWCSASGATMAERELLGEVDRLRAALEHIRGLCRGCLKPRAEHPQGPPCPPYLPGGFAIRERAAELFIHVEAALAGGRT